MARVMLFTDEPVLAKGFSAVLSGAAGFDLVAVCDSPAHLLETLKLREPDVLMVDLNPEITFDFIVELRKRVPRSRLVLWVHTISTELAYQTMRLGISGILRKTLSAEVMIKCLQQVSEGEFWFEEALTASVLATKTISLTRREGQLVSLLSQGLKNKEIAGTLMISEGSVKVYLSKLFRKVGVKDRYELALHGLRNMTKSQLEFVASTQAGTDAKELHAISKPPLFSVQPRRFAAGSGGAN